MDVFDDGPLPISDEHQFFTWKDATLKEVLSTLPLTSLHFSRIPASSCSFPLPNSLC
ncbi:hypothetical protein DL96DRAFT_1624503 [Flagelloscypha sp. PMI_526]|nr:hypothetical protein DL96DRAFT_1624503 [Flagelloscypha sp. PMI_526]